MEVFKTIGSLQKSLSAIPPNLTLGLVPTMGALHLGHLSIVKRAKKENNLVVATIFVNPTQFDKQEDLINYPTSIEKDLKALEQYGCDYVFTPSVEEMYAEGVRSGNFDFEGLDQAMEGRFRKGHFEGVATIVKKLFDIVMPDKAYFGEKDFQQLLIIKKMAPQFAIPVEIVPCEIYREADGLAMSSRNARLDAEQRKAAPLIYKTLNESRERFATDSIENLKKYVKSVFAENELLDLEYFEVAERETLKLAEDKESSKKYNAFIAVFAGPVRLIDNIALN